ncbi:hypothetical protein BV898_04089 [Hypsibius exemplaris]|uniref:Uncharacterized protein n=1 Tax=Hypsibius exemplaris TaxID=2072580 RepID=A0A1W0X319_HYPEX|nr:hypothetical protein BV898_04089 [Hypsibius exemplaris]
MELEVLVRFFDATKAPSLEGNDLGYQYASGQVFAVISVVGAIGSCMLLILISRQRLEIRSSVDPLYAKIAANTII